MSIFINEQEKTFHLTNDKISYIFRVMENKQLEHIYYGSKIVFSDSVSRLVERSFRPVSVVEFDNDLITCLDSIKQEFPSSGGGDFREAAIDVTFENGSHILELEYNSYKTAKGKTKLPGMPATFANQDECETLTIFMKDELSGLEVELNYTIFNTLPVITRWVRLHNNGDENITIERLLSASVDIPDQKYDVIHLSGLWGRERHFYRAPAEPGVKAVYSTRGASSHHHNPFIALAHPEATENHGNVYSMNLVYSGNFLAQVDVDNYYVNRLMIGIHPNRFQWKLKPHGKFYSPEAVLVFSDKGLNGMSHAYHDLYNNHLINPKWAHKARPVVMNNWEGTYLDFTEDKIISIAETASELGVELFVLDDGWFGKRDLDNSSLGDWYVNKEKLPNGIDGLAKKINDLGMEFGLWFEPEMSNSDSHIMKEHPEWIIGTPGRFRKPARFQYVLDYGNPEVVEHIFEMMDDILSNANISYVKWDMNRNISEAYSAYLDSKSQGELMHRYILGVYTLYDKLLERHPNLLIESCASGGGRFDPGMLYYAPQTWTSDDSDAIERLKIQYGTSMVYPVSSIGAHVSAVPNHQVGRITPLDTRANVAFFGVFGYELDPNKLTEEEMQEIKEQIKYYKRNRELLLFGEFTRLASPFEENETMWMVKTKDKEQAIVAWFQVLSIPNDGYQRVRVPGLDPSALYEIEENGLQYTGSELENIGIVLTPPIRGELGFDDTAIMNKRDFDSKIFTLRKVK